MRNSYILNGLFLKLCVYAYYHMNIDISLWKFDQAIFEGVIALEIFIWNNTVKRVKYELTQAEGEFLISMGSSIYLRHCTQIF